VYSVVVSAVLHEDKKQAETMITANMFFIMRLLQDLICDLINSFSIKQLMSEKQALAHLPRLIKLIRYGEITVIVICDIYGTIADVFAPVAPI